MARRHLGAFAPLALALLVSASGCGREGAAAPRFGGSVAEAAAPLAAAPYVPPPTLERVSSKVRRGEPLDAVFRRLELAPGERFEAARALAAEVDLRRILPGELVEIGRDATGAAREIVLRRDPRVAVFVELAADEAPRARTVRRDPEVRLRRLEGEIQGSLYEAVIAAGGDADLVMRFADLLAWQVDFFTEPRPGDRFRMLVEEEHLDGAELGFGKILAAEYRGQRASACATRFVDSDGRRDWYDDDGKSVRRAFLKSPLSYRRISSRFSARRRHPILKTVRPHWGVDYAAPKGTPVSALGGGVVQFAGRKGGYGNYLELRHNSTYTTCYGHLWRFAKGVKRGSRVEQGQVIGYVGSTGLSTGPHLDFRVKRHGHFVDPLRMESPPGRSLSGLEREVFESHRDQARRLLTILPPGEALPASELRARVSPEESRGRFVALAP